MYRLVSFACCLAIVAMTNPAGAAARITGYHNVHIAAPDPEQAVAWYLANLPVEKVPGTMPYITYGGTLIAFQKAEAVRPSQGSGIDHIGLTVPDVDGKVRQLEAAGAKVLTPPRDLPGLYRHAFVEDPFGAKLELIEEKGAPAFHHVHLRVADPAGTLAWYESLVGGAREKLNGQLEGLRYGTIWLFVEPSQGSPLAPSAERAIRNIAWGVRDMDEAAALFKAKGAKTLVEPFVVNKVVRVAFFQDPDGVSVELLQLPQ